nr:hypothetical protein [uncultured Capnocytophaga sp.]
MESKINTIGLTIWGYKQGCKVLASQGVNFQSQEVKDRLKDISAFLRIHTPRADFYMLQFTQSYKIYTQYRSSREVNGQTGVYIAISLYIPHHLQWRGVRQVLNLLMDMYFAEHINYDNNTPLMNEKEDIFPYFNLLRGYEKQLTDDPEAKPCLLQLPYSPKVFPYADIYEVDKYFNMPYRPEFAELQEAVFLRKEFVDDPRAYSIDFLFPEYATVKNANATQATASGTSRFLLMDNVKVLAFMKNGKDVSATYANEIFSDDDSIELLLEKSRYQQMFSFRDTVKKGIKKGYIKKLQDNYALDNITFADKEFKVYVETPQREFEKYLTFLSLESSNFKAKLYSDSKGRYFMLKGEEAHNIFNLSYNGIVFKSNYMIDDRVAISIPFEKYHFTIVSNKVVSIALKINGIVFSKALRSDSPIEIVLPENLYHFEFENQATERMISITKSGEVNFEVASKNYNPQMIASESPKMANTKQLAVVGDNIEEDDEDVVPVHNSRFFWLKIASIVIFVLSLVGIGYWFVFPMLKDPVKAYVAFSSDSKIKDIYFLTNIDERTYEINDLYISLKKTFPLNETKVIIDFAEEGKDTLSLSKVQLNTLAEMVEKGSKDTLKVEVISPARFFLSEVAHWKDTHADPKGTLFLSEAKKRNYLTETLRPEYEKAVWENFLKNFDYSAYNSEQVDSLLSSYLKGGENELKAYQNDLQQIINQSREEEEANMVEEAPAIVETIVAPTPKTERKEPKVPAKKLITPEIISTPTPIVNRTETPLIDMPQVRNSKTIVRHNRNTPRPEATNAKLTNNFIADLKKFNSQLCSEEIVDRVKLNLKRLDAKDWSVVVYDFNQERKEIEERVTQYSNFFTALKKGSSIDNIRPTAFAGQANLIYFLKKGSNFELVKNKPNLKTFADIRQAIIISGVDPKDIR